MTKGSLLPFGAGGNDVSDFHLSVVDDDPIDEQFDQLSALGKGELLQGRLYALAEGFDAGGQGFHFDLLLGLHLQLTQLLGQALLGLRQFLSFALELVSCDDLGQVDFEQPSLLALQLSESISYRATPGLQRLRQPLARLRSLQLMGNEGWLGQDAT